MSVTAVEVSILHTESSPSLWPASHLMKWNSSEAAAMQYDLFVVICGLLFITRCCMRCDNQLPVAS